MVLAEYRGRIERVAGDLAVVSGTDIPVWQVCRALRAGHPVDQIVAAWPACTADDVREIAWFDQDHRYEIDLDIASNQADALGELLG
jgi:uncharacterized protein (DUF433 family)